MKGRHAWNSLTFLNIESDYHLKLPAKVVSSLEQHIVICVGGINGYEENREGIPKEKNKTSPRTKI